MKKYSIRVAHREPGRVHSRVFTFKALGVADALVRFERYQQREMAYEDVEVTAVWQCSACECRARANNPT